MDLSKMVNTLDILREVAYQNEEFNLFDFFDKHKIKGACGFITRRQNFYCEADYHALVFENVGGSIFDDGDLSGIAYYKIFNKYYYSNASGRDYSMDAWRNTNADFGVISMQLLPKGSSFVFIPDKINSFQKQKFLEFYSEINRINEYFVNNGFSKISFYYLLKGKNNEFFEINIDDYINHIDDYVDDNCNVPYENMISDYVYSKHV